MVLINFTTASQVRFLVALLVGRVLCSSTLWPTAFVSYFALHQNFSLAARFADCLAAPQTSHSQHFRQFNVKTNSMNALPAPVFIAQLGPCLIVNKPGGLLTQGPPGIDSLEMRIKSFVKLRDNKTGKVYLGVPHRLDRPASGVMLFARHVRAAKRLAAQFQDRTVEKKYWAIVQGQVAEESGRWVDHLRKLPDQAKSEICAESDAGGQLATLRFEVLERNEKCSWLEIQLETGRTHQIRLQSAHRGHPIIGDELYGSSIPFGPATPDKRKKWIALHAREITFNHPMQDERLCMTAPLWEHWQQLEFDLPRENAVN